MADDCAAAEPGRELKVQDTKTVLPGNRPPPSRATAPDLRSGCVQSKSGRVSSLSVVADPSEQSRRQPLVSSDPAPLNRNQFPSPSTGPRFRHGRDLPCDVRLRDPSE